jgi:hypothetical protein
VPLEPYQTLLFPDDPAPATDFVYTVPGDSRVEITTVMCELACAAGGADRGVSLQFANWNGRRFLVAGTRVKVAASTTQAYCWQNGVGAETWAVDDAALAGMPSVILLPQCTATIHVTGVQAGDQLSSVALGVNVYPPRDVDAGPVADPLLDALVALDVEKIAREAGELRADIRELADALGASQVESRRDRLQREALALRG